MCRVVAFAALRELGMNAGSVRHAVAIAALRNNFVFVGVAHDAGDIVVLGLAGLQLGECHVVASSTHDVLGCVRVLKQRRCVGSVAGCTVVLRHVAGVNVVTLGAGRNIAVGVGVAEITGNFRVRARSSNKLGILLGMTGETFCFQLTIENDIEGLVRVVAGEAVGQCIVIAPLVALGAGRNIVLADRAVAVVTIDTVNLFFVCGTGISDLLRFLTVTLAAIVNREFGGQRACREQDKRAQQQDREQVLCGRVAFHGSSWKDVVKYTGIEQ